MQTIEVCFLPGLFERKQTEAPFTVVVVDVLRASSAICAAFQNGVKSIIPVSKLSEAEEYKKQGFLVAAERDGLQPDFADFGNSPLGFSSPLVRGRTLVYTTTNGTQALITASVSEKVVVGTFSNFSKLCQDLLQAKKNVVVLCSGWKENMSLEDTAFAGALVENLTKSGFYETMEDAAQISLGFWNNLKKNFPDSLNKATHYKRLSKLGLDEDIAWCLRFDTTEVVPFLENGILKIS
ncbi:MAG: 2-phosphosulfolactate phosphatase [Lentimicrobiaceae bacterium]|nr:2-phosphosulfolactate phosphatase [Lentimicrobiaceae bacterium]